MSEVEWRGRTLPVKIDKARIFLLGLADNEAAIAQVSQRSVSSGISFSSGRGGGGEGGYFLGESTNLSCCEGR